MARTKISEFSATAADNTDIDNINIAEGCAPSGINNAIRELMAQLKDMQTGASGDAFTLTTVNSTTVDTTNLEATNLKAKDGTAAGSIANSTGVVTLASTVLTTTDINGGTVDGTTIGASTPSTVVATQVDITAQGDLRLQDTTGGEFVALQAPGTLASSYTLTLPVDDGTAGQALITDGSGVLSWSSAASGDVYGPASATDNAVARYDGTTGKIIQNSAVTIADDGATVIAANSTTDGLRITQLGTGNALVVEDSANPDSTPFVVDASGNVVVGNTTTRSTGALGTSQLSIENAGFAAAQLFGNQNGTAGGYLGLWKARGGAVGGTTNVQNADELGAVYFGGYADGGFRNGALVGALVDGSTISSSSMPTRLVFSTSASGSVAPTERMRIDSAGNVGIGSSLAGLGGVYGNVSNQLALSGSVDESAYAAITTINSSVTTSAVVYKSQPTTQASSFTLGALVHFDALQFGFGAGSTVTNQYGFRANSGLTGATNNFGFRSDIASGTGRWNFYANGTADNYFAGNVGIGTTTPAERLTVATGTSEFAIQWGGPGKNWLLGSASNRMYVRNKTDSIETLTILNGGNVGIGTGSPTAKLTVTAALGATPASFDAGEIVTLVNSSLSGDTRSVAFGTAPDGSGYLRTIRDMVFVAVSTERMRITNAGTISLGAVPGAESLRVTPVASAVNFLEINGAIAASKPFLYANGSDESVSMNLVAKGAGSYTFLTSTGTATQFQIAHTASAVNYLQVTGSAGSSPSVSAQGTSANVNVTYATKGTGFHNFTTGGLSTSQFVVTHTASAVNYLQVTGGATGVPTLLFSTGSDANVGLNYVTKGTGAHQFICGFGANAQFVINHAASAVNAIAVNGAVTGDNPMFNAVGSDTNIGFKFITKGTGKMQYGTHTANADVAITGYIEILDLAGNVRKLAVIT